MTNPTVDPGVTGHVLKGVNDGIDYVLHYLLYTELFLILGFLGVLQWHLLTMKMRSGIMRTFGRNILVLNLYYSPRIHELIPGSQQKPFVLSCFTIFFDNVVLWLALRELKWIKKENNRGNRGLQEDLLQQPEPRAEPGHQGLADWLADRSRDCWDAHLAEYPETRFKLPKAYGPPPDEDEKTKPFKNVYMYFARPLRRAAFFFIAQFGLMMYYVYNLNSDPDTHDPSKVSEVKWFFAVMITAVAGEDETGSDYLSAFWGVIFGVTASSVKETFVNICNCKVSQFWEVPGPDPKLDPPKEELRRLLHNDPEALAGPLAGESEQTLLGGREKPMDMYHHVFYCIYMTYRSEWRVRWWMDWTVNALFRAILMGTAPIMLCVEDPLDFIKDCLAIFFIAKLDDYDEAKTFKEFKEEADHYEMPELLQNRLFWGLKRDADDRDWSRTSLLEQD